MSSQARRPYEAGDDDDDDNLGPPPSPPRGGMALRGTLPTFTIASTEPVAAASDGGETTQVNNRTEVNDY